MKANEIRKYEKYNIAIQTILMSLELKPLFVLERGRKTISNRVHDATGLVPIIQSNTHLCLTYFYSFNFTTAYQNYFPIHA